MISLVANDIVRFRSAVKGYGDLYMYLLLFIVRWLLGIGPRGTYVVQLARSDGRLYGYQWGSGPKALSDTPPFDDLWAEAEDDPRHRAGRDVNRGSPLDSGPRRRGCT